LREFCKKYEILISTSLDGTEEIHNANRPKKGSDGYEVTVAGIKRVMAYLGNDRVSALMTTTEKSLSQVKEIINTYVDIGFNNIFLRSLSPYGFAVKTKQIHKYDVNRWLEFYKEGLSYIIEINKAGKPFVEQYTSLLLNKMFSNFSTGYVDLQSPAGLGITVLVYNYDGKVYASDESRMLAEMGDTKFCLGDLNSDSYSDIMLSDVLLDTLESTINTSVPRCSECAYMTYCGSEPVYHYTTQNDVVGHKVFSGFCAKNMGLFEYLLNLIRTDEAAAEILLGWVRI
jgi:His-Xaa-Ser system radical SAM maturase HxsB